MTFLLEIAKIQRIIIYLIVHACVIISVAAFELQQENDIAVQHHHVYTLAHPGDRVFKYNSTIANAAKLILEYLHLYLPSVTLLNRHFRRNVA